MIREIQQFFLISVTFTRFEKLDCRFLHCKLSFSTVSVAAKAVNGLAVRYVKQGTEAAGFRAGSITLVNMLV